MSCDWNIVKGHSAEIMVQLDNDREVSGRFFLADNAPDHYGEETLLDLLNRPEKLFVPLECDGESAVMLVRKSCIVGLRPKFANSSGWPALGDDDESSWTAARFVCGRVELDGHAYTGDMKPERHRLLDLLNQVSPFILFETEDGPWILNSHLVQYAFPLD